jgi:hypothetical protein
MRKSRFSEEQISGIRKRVEAGQPVADVCRGRVTRARHQRRHVLPLESPVWGLGGQPAQTLAAAGRREPQAQTGGGGPDAR